MNDHGNNIVEDYLKAPKRSVGLVFTNPPFGKRGSLALKFINKASLDSDRLAFIVPSSFKKTSVLDSINPEMHLIGCYDLPDQNYRLPDGSTRFVKTTFQLWERRSYFRILFKNTVNVKNYFNKVTVDTADYALRTQGSAAGRVLNGLYNKDGSTFSTGTTVYLQNNRDRIEAHDWSTIASFTAATPSIGLVDIALGLMVEDSGGDLTAYLNQGAPFFYETH